MIVSNFRYLEDHLRYCAEAKILVAYGAIELWGFHMTPIASQATRVISSDALRLLSYVCESNTSLGVAER